MDDFLAANGWADAVQHPLTADASNRCYIRLARNNHRVLLMNAPPPTEDVRPFVSIARHLRGLGLSAPEILAEDPDGGFLLLEDFGDDTYTRLLAEHPESERALYELAVDVLIDLHHRPPDEAIPPGLIAYDGPLLLEKAHLLTDWYLPAMTGGETVPAVRADFDAAWANGFAAVEAQPQTLVLRDYHVDNLMRLDGRQGVAACGLLDFQDAVSGASAYDLMSLLEDARRDLGDGLKQAMLERYFAGFSHLANSGPARDAFMTAFAVLSAQRHARVIGLFVRLNVSDAKPAYLQHLPRLWRLLEQSLNEPVLASLRQWFNEHFPPHLRGIPAMPEAN